MANSSDWIAALGAAVEVEHETGSGSGPGWLALLAEPGEFREALPFAMPAAEDLAPEPNLPEPAPAEDALAAARAEGEAAGRAAAAAEAEHEAARHRALRLAFRTLDEAALAVLAEDLAATVTALCEQVLGEAAIAPQALAARCRAAAERIGGAAAALRLRLHPKDIARLEGEWPEAWTIVPDVALAPGSLLLEGPDGAVSDGPAEWRRAIAAAVRG